jgi:SAM-dependent methyltransferase
MINPRVDGNTSFMRADLEIGIPMANFSVDLVTSVSSVQHLSAPSQVNFLREVERVLVPGGIVAMTVSYLIVPSEHTLAVLSPNAIPQDGFAISAELNLRRMLEAAPSLVPPEAPDWSRFPGYDGFSSERLRGDRDILLDAVDLDPSLPSAAEVGSLGARRAEIGIFLVKS